MAGLALLFTYFYMLAMVKINMVGQVMDLYPFNGFGPIRHPVIILIGIVVEIYAIFRQPKKRGAAEE